MDRKFIDGDTLETPRLYIIMRKDLYQMNPGKLAAQAAHAGTMFVFDTLDEGHDSDAYTQMMLWAGRKGFGTKITLEATLTDMEATLVEMHRLGLRAGVVEDPTYPYSNWNGDHYTSVEETCMYVFAPCTVPREALDYLRRFKLHP